MAALCQAIRIDGAANFVARISGSPVSVIHHKRARLAELLMPDVERGADCQSRVSRRRMNVNVFERCGVKDFSVRHAIESDAACETHGFEPGSLAEFFQHAEINFFKPRLQRACEIAVPFL